MLASFRAVIAVASLTRAACIVVPDNTTAQGQQGGYAQTSGGQAYAQGGASCEGACQHYLECRGSGDASSYQACVMQCRAQGYDPNSLAQYQMSDCATAVSIVEGGGGGAGGGGGGGGGGGSQCAGCQWDGSSCIWIASADSSAGINAPYSGAVTSCDSSCCGR